MKHVFFCSKMHLKLAFSNSFWQIQPNFNPATLKRPSLKQVLRAFKREKLKHVLRLGDHRDLSPPKRFGGIEMRLRSIQIGVFPPI